MTIERARLSVKFSIERLKKQTAEQFDRKFPGDHPGPQKWLEIIFGLLDTADNYLEKSNDPNCNPQDAEQLVSDTAQISNLAYQCLEIMRGADINELPYPIVPPLQRWFDQVNIINSTFFRAELVANYEKVEIDGSFFKRIRNPAPRLLQAISNIEWPMFRITVPSKTYGVLSHFAIVAHELGHAIYPRINWDLTQFTNTEYPKIVQRIAQRLKTQALDIETQTHLMEVFQKWFEELAADAIAFKLTGPAIFFALSEFLQLLGGYGLCHSHPAHDLRRIILYKKLCEGDSNSFKSIFDNHTKIQLTESINSVLLVATPKKDQIFNDMNAQYQDNKLAAVLAELHESMENVVDIIYDQIDSYMQSNTSTAIYTSKKYDEDLSKHLEPIIYAIPPIEFGEKLEDKTPTEFSSVLNVGWAALLTQLGDLKIQTDNNKFGEEKLENLHGLLLKAVELSEARRLWSNS